VKHWIILTTVCVSIILKQTSHFAITFEEIQLANSYPVFPHPATNQLNKNQEIITKNITYAQRTHILHIFGNKKFSNIFQIHTQNNIEFFMVLLIISSPDIFRSTHKPRETTDITLIEIRRKRRRLEVSCSP
jgi:hypothetical protein